MLPRADMVATKNSPRKTAFLIVVAALLGLAGCAPPGPRALLKGDQLLRDGKPAQAITELKLATELLPGEPRAWNLLGLAYHRAGQPQPATLAYRQALLHDRSNLVAVAHFNLGCLLLEQNQAAGAVDALRSYTLITNNPAGFARLGSAQSRLRQFTEAEKSFNAALRLDPKNAEALNGVGVIHAFRGQRDAAQYFASAIQVDPKYAPALLNSAALAQQSPATKLIALQRYRDYLAVRSSGPQADQVKSLVRQLETELAPPAPPTRMTNLTVLKTNAPVAAVTNVNPPVATQAFLTKATPPVVIAKTNPVVANPIAVVTNKPAPPPVIVPVTVVSVASQAPPKIAIHETPAPKPDPNVTIIPYPKSMAETPPTAPPVLDISPATVEKKRGFFSRLNPFGGKPKVEATNDSTRTVVLNPDTAPATPDIPARAIGERPTFPRYRYTSPTPPAAGDRAAADRALQQALAAQRAGRNTEASAAFASALAADPSYFEAQYNSALLSFQTGETAKALTGWETALALQPDSLIARYSFALTLKQGGHATDAAQELEKIIDAKPDDARAHLALGNLYAQQLLDTDKARAHYKKYLELEPRSPQAAAIRFWLAANP
jgi:Flp pilus assembly protein TadD